MKRPEDYRPENYLCGKPANRNYSNGDRLREAHKAAYPDQPMSRDRWYTLLIILSIFGLCVLGAVAWGWPMLVEAITRYVDMGVGRWPR